MSRGPHVCPECGGHYRNKWAHAEECTGPPAGGKLGEVTLAVHTGRCQSRRRNYGAFSTYSQCVRPWNHEGDHIYQ